MTNFESSICSVNYQEFFHLLPGAFTCQSVDASEIETGSLNGVDINQFHRDVVTVDGTHAIYGMFSLYLSFAPYHWASIFFAIVFIVVTI